jgi:hypothetical protein
MAPRHVKSFSLAVLLLAVLCINGLAHFSSGAQETARQNSFAGDAALKEVADYRQWTRVTGRAIQVSRASLGG